MTLGELIDAKAVKKAYRKACIAIHPDKQPAGDVAKKVHARARARARPTVLCSPALAHAQVLAQHVFDALRDAWGRFES